MVACSKTLEGTKDGTFKTKQRNHYALMLQVSIAAVESAEC